MPDLLARLLVAILSAFVRLHVISFARMIGYRNFEPNRESVLITCCTNGLGHVHQMERVLSVLQQAGLQFPVIALAKEQKVPSYKLESLKRACKHTGDRTLDSP